MSAEDRRRTMQAVRSTGTAVERRVAAALRHLGVRYRSQVDLPGHPDYLLPELKTAVFVHGCFWHGHECRPAHRMQPRANADYWARKLARNQRRDRRARRALNSMGLSVFVLWECTLATDAAALRQVARAIARLSRTSR